jgi:glycerol-3-phosphate dehydrogenase
MTVTYDVVVIGGGIHGVGVAQAAAAAGQRVLLLEKTGLASATSSRSSKLIHGGLRYLESAQFGLVRESLRERALLLRLAPDLVRLLPFHIPIYAATTRRPWKIRAGLSLYALLGNLDPACRFAALPRAHWAELDGLVTDGLQTVFRYFDAQTDDAALTRAVMASAETLGAELACPARFVSAERHADGIAVHYSTPTADITCQTHCVVNAAGPWVDQVQRQLMPGQPVQPIQLVQGAHIQVAGRLTQGAYYLEAPQDRRAVFVTPWYDRTLVGTTESLYTGDPGQVQPLLAEITYLQKTLAHYFPARPLELVDSFAGLRVLPIGNGSAFHRPRETRLPVDDPRRPRIVNIYGGKLTGYRATAQRVMRLLQGTLPQRPPQADTTKIPLQN